MWWCFRLVAVLLLSAFAPTAIVILAGLLFPNATPWTVANAAIVVGAVISAVASTLVLARSNTITSSFRALGAVLILWGAFQYSRIEFFTSEECVTQQGKYIDLQRQERERRAAGKQSCE